MKSVLGRIIGKGGKETRDFPVKASQKRPVPENQQSAAFYKPGDLLLNDYEVHEVLGVGGCGIVYLVYSRKTESVYALKTFREDFATDKSVRERFRQEAHVWVDLERHPYLVRAYFVQEIEGRLFVGMEYVAPNEDGINSLSDYLEYGSISLEQCLDWAIQFCYGMEHAYTKGIRCHRDIKPANILIDRNAVVKISDFGLAGALRSPNSSVEDSSKQETINANSIQTLQGFSFGTPTHMSPEQFIDAAQCDERSDIYSFGVVLHQMQNNGVLPFLAPLPNDGTFAEQMRFWESMFHLHVKAPIPACVSPISSIIRRCLEKDRSSRYQTFTRLRSDIEKILFDKPGRKISRPDVREYDAWEWNCKGGSFFELGHPKQALDCFDKALAIAPWFWPVWTNKALVLRSLNRHNEALDSINKALELDPSSDAALINKGSLLNKLRQFDQAIDCFDEALRVKNYLYEAWSGKGDSFMSLGRFDDALICFNKSLALFSRASQVWHHKAICLQSIGKAEAAIECCDNAIAINPQASMALHTKALSLSALQKHEAAYFVIKQALSTEPSHPMALFIKAGIEEELGKDLEALTSYREFLKYSSHEDDEQIDFANNRIRFLEAKNDEPAAIKSAKERLAKAASTSPGKMSHISALNDLASAYKAMKHFDKAILTYKEALSVMESKYGPESPVIVLAPTLSNFANLYHGLGKYMEAKNLYERVIRLIENDETYGPNNRNLGVILTSFSALQSDLRNYSEAQSLCERALRIKEKEFGVDSIELVSTLEHYARALEGNGLASKALAVKLRLNQIRKRVN